MSDQLTTIGNDLIEAYEGIFEDDLERELREPYRLYIASETAKGAETVEDFEGYRLPYVKRMIRESSPKRRLEVYCEWNGLIGYGTRLYEIATGEG